MKARDYIILTNSVYLPRTPGRGYIMNTQTQQVVVKRLRRARGHLTKVIKMVENCDYCPDVLLQSSAVQAAIKKSDEIILNSHLHTCVVPKLGGKTDETTITELLEVFKRR